MDIEEFKEWLYDLPLQTLTDELKDDIIENIESNIQEQNYKESQADSFINIQKDQENYE